MYYHFCLLCAFRPFVSLTLDNANVRPQEICTQAVQWILELAQSYDNLFTLRRVSGFIPYFICASGLFSLGMEGGGSQVRPFRLRRADDECEDDRPQGSTGPGVTMAAETSHIKISPAAHALALLARIGSTHLAARTAEQLLRREITSRFKQRQEDLSPVSHRLGPASPRVRAHNQMYEASLWDQVSNNQDEAGAFIAVSGPEQTPDQSGKPNTVDGSPPPGCLTDDNEAHHIHNVPKDKSKEKICYEGIMEELCSLEAQLRAATKSQLACLANNR